MSHWEKVESQIDDLDTLESACLELGASVKRNAIARGYSRAGSNSRYGKDKLSDMVIQVNGSVYDISVTLDKKTGVYSLEGEWMGGYLEKAFKKGGHKLGKILEMYSVHKAEKICRAKRKSFSRVVHDDRIDVEVYV